MRKPEIGQLLATADGQQFRVSQVDSTFDPNDPESDADGFMVFLVEVHGSPDWELELLDSEFEEWCEGNGISY